MSTRPAPARSDGASSSPDAPLAATARHRNAIATLIAREPRIFATQNPFRASTSAMPSVKTRPSTVAKSQPASAAPVSEKASAWLIVSNESANAAPMAAMNAGWLARESCSVS